MPQLRVRYGEDHRGQGFYWSTSDHKRAEYFTVKRNRPAEAEAVYQCRPGAREGQIFLESDFVSVRLPDGMTVGDLAQGMSNPLVKALVAKGHCVGLGWDTAFEATAAANWTVGIAGLLIPCQSYHCGEDPVIYGECEPHFDVLILNVKRAKLQWADLVRDFRAQHIMWEPEWHVVEKKGSGITLYQSFTAIGMNIEGVEAIENKRSRALQGVGAGSVQGAFRQHRVLFPIDYNGNEPEWLKSLKVELKDFSGAKDAVDDQVDAAVHLVTKAIKLGIEAGLMPSEWKLDRVNELMGMPKDGLLRPMIEGFDLQNAAAQLINFIGMAETMSTDIFADRCGRCEFFERGLCKKFIRQMTELDGCDEFVQRKAA